MCRKCELKSKDSCHCHKKDNVVGIWNCNITPDIPNELARPETLTFHPDGLMTHKCIDKLPSGQMPSGLYGDLSSGLWKKVCKNKYEGVSVKANAKMSNPELCCPAERFSLTRVTFTITISKCDKNKATVKGVLEAWPWDDICFKTAPLISFNFAGDACRLKF